MHVSTRLRIRIYLAELLEVPAESRNTSQNISTHIFLLVQPVPLQAVSVNNLNLRL